MIIRNSRKQDARSPFSQLLRTTGVIIVLISAGILFWKYYEISMGKIMGPQNVKDQTTTLSQGQLDSIQKFSQALKSTYGQKFELQVRREAFKQPPDTDSKTIFLGVCPQQEQVILKLPALVQNALPKGFTKYVEDKHFQRYWEAGTWDQGILDCLNLVWSQLNKLQKEKTK